MQFYFLYFTITSIGKPRFFQFPISISMKYAFFGEKISNVLLSCYWVFDINQSGQARVRSIIPHSCGIMPLRVRIMENGTIAFYSSIFPSLLQICNYSIILPWNPYLSCLIFLIGRQRYLELFTERPL